MNYVRTAILLAGLTALFMGVGYLIGGGSGAVIALIVGRGMNLFAYWNADKLVLSMHGAQEVDARTAPDLVSLVRDLAQRAGLPMPRVYVMDNPQPNAFATGRNPEHAAVAVTTGLMHTLSRDEIAGVIAHELAHIRNRDTLIMTITATIAGAISMLAQFGLFFGGHRDNNSGLGIIGTIAMVILAPIAAMLVQMAISRTREYAADRLGAADHRAPGCARLGAGEDFQRRAADREPERRAQPGDRASVHHQSADPRRVRQPVLDPSVDREPHRRAARLAGEMGQGGFGRRPAAAAPDHARGRPALGAPPAAVRGVDLGGRALRGRRAHMGHDFRARFAAGSSRFGGAPHRRRHSRRGAAPPPPARRAARRTRPRMAISPRSPTAIARWCAPWSPACCAGSARCATCSAVCSHAGFPAKRRGWRPHC